MADTTANTELEHKGLIVDSDTYFEIDPITRNITSDSKKVSLMQYDHNSERFTFSIPKNIEGHDMTNCTIRIHYCNIGTDRSTYNGLYEVRDAMVDPNNSDKIKFTWLISQNATQYAGSIKFLIEFTCVKTLENGEAEVWYRWSTNINKNINIVVGMNNNDSVDERYVDLITEWEAMIKEHLADCNERLENGISEIIGYLPTGENEVSLKTVTELNQNKKMSIWVGTQEEYDAITDKDLENVFYIIKDDTVAEEFDDLQSRLTAAEGEIDALQSGLSTAEGEIDDLQEDLTATNSNIEEYLRMDSASIAAGNDAVSRLSTAEGEIDDLQKNSLTTESVSNLITTDVLLDATTTEKQELPAGTQIKVDTSATPGLFGSATLLLMYPADENYAASTVYSIRTNITSDDGGNSVTELYLYQGSDIIQTIYADGAFNSGAITYLQSIFNNDAIQYYNRVTNWNNWLYYETVEKTEGNCGYLKKSDGTYFLPYAANGITSVYVESMTYYSNYNNSNLENYWILLPVSNIPSGKTVDDIVAISFTGKLTNGQTLYFSAVKTYGNVFNFTTLGPLDYVGENSVPAGYLFSINLPLEQSSDGSIVVDSPSYSYVYFHGSSIIPTISGSNSVSLAWTNAEPKNILIYFK